jgi:hypothetical protein
LEAIKKQAERWNTNRKKRNMISNILSRETIREQVDRVNDEITGQLETEEEEVKKLTKEFFERNNRLRNWSTNMFWKNWWKEYEDPMVKIDMKGKNQIAEEITLQEVESAIHNSTNGKAPGPSNQSYEMFKNCSIEEKETIRHIFNNIMQMGEIPEQWKHARIYPIPKISNWQG